ncbi:MAG: N-acetylmuramoyl-L-alanine amidase [Lachnospiraceae bacterium]|nr:N-acetylmuramoyl-L-alanine amidase [Lachnospiraceae bacterium]
MPRISKKEWKRRRRRKRMIIRYSILSGFAIIAILILVLIVKLISGLVSGNDGIIKKAGDVKIEEKLLTVDNNTRSGQELKEVKGIIIHNTAEPGQTADGMWTYYDKLADSGNVSESMHFIVDEDGSIIQSIPCNEIAFHAMSKNSEAIGIQYCHASQDGSMSKDAYDSLVALVVELCEEYDLDASDVKLHYDVTSRPCPEYYVNNPELWQDFLSDVKKELE